MKETLVRDWMTPDPIIIPSNCTLPDAFWLMINHKVRRLLVVDRDQLVGIVTLEDLRGKVPSILTSMNPLSANNMLAKLPVHRVMTENPKTVQANVKLIDAARLMLQYQISTLPVMDGSRLVGIITESDIFRALVKQLEAER